MNRMFTACAVTVCLASLLMGQFTTRTPRPRKGMVYFVGHATAATTIEEGKRIALDDVCHQILVYAGAEVHSALSGKRVNGYSVSSEQISISSASILQSLTIRKISSRRRRVYAEGYGIFDVYDVQVIAAIQGSILQSLTGKAKTGPRRWRGEGRDPFIFPAGIHSETQFYRNLWTQLFRLNTTMLSDKKLA